MEHLRGKISSSIHAKVNTRARSSGETTGASVLLYARINISKSLPSLHLFGERALCTIGIVLHTKIFVNLKQTLLVRDSLQELFPARIVSEKARRSCFQPAVR